LTLQSAIEAFRCCVVIDVEQIVASSTIELKPTLVLGLLVNFAPVVFVDKTLPLIILALGHGQASVVQFAAGMREVSGVTLIVDVVLRMNNFVA
jgi:hypothetical protein